MTSEMAFEIKVPAAPAGYRWNYKDGYKYSNNLILHIDEKGGHVLLEREYDQCKENTEKVIIPGKWGKKDRDTYVITKSTIKSWKTEDAEFITADLKFDREAHQKAAEELLKRWIHQHTNIVYVTA